MTEKASEEQRLKRRRRAETRQLMLVAGALVAEAYAMGEAPHHDQPALSHIRFDEVLELATKLQLYFESQDPPVDESGFDPLTYAREHIADIEAVEIENVKAIGRGSAYFAFDDEGDYRSKLVDFLLGVERWPDVGVWERAFSQLKEQRGGQLPPFDQAVRVVARASFEHWVQRPEPLLEMALAQFALEPELAETFEETSSRGRHGGEDEPGLNAWFAEFLRTYDRNLRPGIDLDQLTTLVMCLTYGLLFGSRSAAQALSVPVDWDGESTSLPAVAVEALVSYLTVATDPGSPQS